MSTFQQMPTYQGGKRTGSASTMERAPAAPSLRSTATRHGRAGDSLHHQRPGLQVGRGFSSVWNPSPGSALPKLGLKVSAVQHRRSEAQEGRAEAGTSLSFLYEYEDQIKTGSTSATPTKRTEARTRLSEDFDYKKGDQEVLWGAFGSGFLELNPTTSSTSRRCTAARAEDETILQLAVSRTTTSFRSRRTATTSSGDRSSSTSSPAITETSRTARRGFAGTRGQHGSARRTRPAVRFSSRSSRQTIASATRFFSDLKQISVGGKTSVRFPLYEAFDSTAYARIGMDAGYDRAGLHARRFTQQGSRGRTLVRRP